MTKTIFNSERISQVDFIQDRKGEYQAIVKVQAGFMTTVDDLGIKCKWESGPSWKRAINVFRSFKKVHYRRFSLKQKVQIIG